MKSLCTYIFIILAIVAIGSFSSCKSDISIDRYTDASPSIFPDYSDVTVPCNIAPLNFHVEMPTGKVAAIFRFGADSIIIDADDGDIEIPLKDWQRMLRSDADVIRVTVLSHEEGKHTAYKPFDIHVSPDSIDPVLVYRLIPPLYGTWRKMGIYQRSLESFDESPIYENTAYRGNCVNCHSFCSRNPDQMQLHMRSEGGATYIYDRGQKRRLDTKTDSTIATFTYPYWHPSGRYIAYSVNSIFQVFHTSDPNVTEVIDDKSDVVVYDILNNEVFSAPELRSPSRLETLPAFSAEGNKLFFCSAVLPDTLPEKYKEVKYNICSIDFDPEKAQFGPSVDTLYSTVCVMDALKGKSMTFPRPSPDGRFLVATLSEYGNFKIWHKDADLWICELSTGVWRPLREVNSQDVDSYHSWSSNSRWMVFSSRRTDGLYTRPYITHIDEHGVATKAFLLPQSHPDKYYSDQKNSFNIPELVDGFVNLDTPEIARWIEFPATQVSYRK